MWFVLSEDRSLDLIAGIRKVNHTCVRKMRDGEDTRDVFAVLTTTPNAKVAAMRSKTKPVILTTAEEAEKCMRGAWSEACALRRSSPDDVAGGSPGQWLDP